MTGEVSGRNGAAGADGPEPTRRELVDVLLVGALGATAIAALVPALGYIVPPDVGESEEASAVLPFALEELPRNSGRIFKFGNEPGLVIRTDKGDVRAFGARCTHLACIVQYAPREGRINCACHGGWFDLSGKNVAGPPPRPLEAFTVNLRRRQGGEGHDIVVSRT